MKKNIGHCLVIIIFLSICCLNVIEFANAQSPINNRIDISGIYISDKLDIYNIKQINNTVWILGTTAPDSPPETIANIFSGTLDDNFNKITGRWIDYPLTNNTKGGNIHLALLMNDSKKNITIDKISQTTESNSVYPVNTLTKYDPAVHGPLTIYISIENILIDIPRSPTSDMLYIGISGQRNNDAPITATKYFGSKADGSNISTDLRIGPFLIDSKNDFLKVYLLGLDKDDGTPSFTLLSLRNMLMQLTEASYNVTDLAHATNIISSLSPALTPRGCNGLVFLDDVEMSSESLRNITAFNGKYSQEKTYGGTTSPPGCGPPSQYVVNLSIKAQR